MCDQCVRYLEEQFDWFLLGLQCWCYVFSRWPSELALIPIVEGAGGVVTDWQGGNPSLGGDVIASGDPRLHEAALRELAANG